MKTTKTIKLSEFGIVITLDNVAVNDGPPHGGTITSDMKEGCPFCGQTDCDFSCDESQADGFDDDGLWDNENRIKYNISIDALESLILAHACAGIDVEAYGYVEGIRTALQTLAKEYE